MGQGGNNGRWRTVPRPMADTCTHLDTITDAAPAADGCVECLATGDRWVHLRRCAECGHVAAGNRVTQAQFRCLACGHQDHADTNAARNILRAGLALQEAEKAT